MINFFRKNNTNGEDIYRDGPEPEEDNMVAEPEKKEERFLSNEFENEIYEYDEVIDEKRSDYEDINDLIEKTVRSDHRHRQEIDTMQISREEELSDEHDKSVYAEADFKKWVLSKIPLVGANKGRYLREGRKVYDREELSKEEKENQEEKNVGWEEKLDLASKEGIPVDEFLGLGYKKRYSETEDGLVKIIERDATESEKTAKAQEIFNTEMQGWQRHGQFLIEKKERLERHKKDSEKFKELLNDDMISADTKDELTRKAEDEQKAIEEDIEFEEGILRDEIESYKESFVEQRKASTEMIEEFSLAVENVKKRKKELTDKVKKINNNIRSAQKLQILGDAQADLIKEFEEQMAQAEFDIKEFSLREEKLSGRLNMAKSYKSGLDKLIKDMDSIGKTKHELRQEKESLKTQNNTENVEEDESQNTQNNTENADEDESQKTLNDDENESQKTLNDAEKNVEKDASKTNKANKAAAAQTVGNPKSPDDASASPDKQEPEEKKVGDMLVRLGINKKGDKAAARQYFKKSDQKYSPKTKVNFNEAKNMYLSFLYNYHKIDDASILDEKEKELKRYFGIKDED
jgi:hypothetical protein